MYIMQLLLLAKSTVTYLSILHDVFIMLLFFFLEMQDCCLKKLPKLRHSNPVKGQRVVNSASKGILLLSHGAIFTSGKAGRL